MEAARVQLDAAIRLVFSGGEPVVARTLAGAASVIVHDICKARGTTEFWSQMVTSALGMSERDYFRIARRSANFFKHADDDPDSSLDFDPLDTDVAIFTTTLDLHGLRALSLAEIVFQRWYLCLDRGNRDSDSEVGTLIKDAFPGIERMRRDEQLAFGARELARAERDRWGGQLPMPARGWT